MIVILIFMIVWVICGVITYRAMLSNFKNKFPKVIEENEKECKKLIFKMSIAGPIGLIAWIFIFITENLSSIAD